MVLQRNTHPTHNAIWKKKKKLQQITETVQPVLIIAVSENKEYRQPEGQATSSDFLPQSSISSKLEFSFSKMHY